MSVGLCFPYSDHVLTFDKKQSNLEDLLKERDTRYVKQPEGKLLFESGTYTIPYQMASTLFVRTLLENVNQKSVLLTSSLILDQVDNI